MLLESSNLVEFPEARNLMSTFFLVVQGLAVYVKPESLLSPILKPDCQGLSRNLYSGSFAQQGDPNLGPTYYSPYYKEPR